MEQGHTPSGVHAFDDLVGTWHVQNKRKRGDYFLAPQAPEQEALWEYFPAVDRFEKQLDGRAIVEHWEATLPSGERAVGLSVKAFDPATAQWFIVWIDNRHPLDFRPLIGSFEAGVGAFFQVIETTDGHALHVRFIWDEITATTARWQQAFSFDEGQTWETNWIMEFRRSDSRQEH